MKTMSNVDVFAVAHELDGLLKGAKVNKAYQPLEDTIILRLHVKDEGRVDLLIQAGVRVHITRYPLENPMVPPSFPMLLRKHLKGGIIQKIEQYDFDRILKVRIKRDRIYTLVVELFGKGNIILLDEDDKIILPLRREVWSERKILPGETYKHPPEHAINPLEADMDQLTRQIKESETDIVRTLARNGLGGLYAEEVLLKAGIQKNLPANKLNTNDIRKVYEAINETFKPLKKLDFTPNIIEDKDVIPLELEIYKNRKREYYNTYNEAADEFFAKKIREKIKREKEKIWEDKIKKYEKRLRIQKETLKNYKRKAKESSLKGDLIYSNYKLIQNLLKTISKARKEYPYEEILKRLKKGKKEGIPEAQLIESVDKKGKITIRIEDKTITLDTTKSLEENAEAYYEKAKKAKKKIDGVKDAIRQTKDKIKEIKEKREISLKKISLPEKRLKRKLKWFEKFRWFISSQGFLVLAGRDATTNEILVKKYMEDKDLYLHSDIHGAPSVIIKSKGEKIPENTIKEAAIFAASFSNAWKQGYSHLDVYWVHPDQVTKTPPPGEYVQKGAFVIKGRRNYIRGVPLEIAVGIIDYEGPRIMSGPISALKKHAREYVIIKPGYTKKEAIAKEILKRIDLDQLFTLEDIMRVLPPGKCDLV
ncbi:MAG: ribosome rescue protein RqcH [Methanothermobacter sp.]|nr:ribosome rescue protein RqcH [Methanothermobacter sp.]